MRPRPRRRSCKTGSRLTFHDIRAIQFNAGDVFDFNNFTDPNNVGTAFSYDVVRGLLLNGPPIEPPAAVPGDLNGDGFVGVDDLNIVLSSWNLNTPPGDSRADPSGDGFVGVDDLNVVLSNWNAGLPLTSATPEPGSAIIFLGSTAIMLTSRRKGVLPYR